MEINFSFLSFFLIKKNKISLCDSQTGIFISLKNTKQQPSQTTTDLAKYLCSIKNK